MATPLAGGPLISNAKWRTAPYVPTQNDRDQEQKFLNEHLESGARLHSVAGEALTAALHTATDTSQRELLALRLFAEYVNSLETMGAWAWAIRNRASAPLLIDAFLSYSAYEVREFYKTVSMHDGELSDLLTLPGTQVITDAMRLSGVPHGPLLADFERLHCNLKQAATHYFHPQQLFVTTYNKAKHGAPIVHEGDLATGEFLLLAPNRDPMTCTHRYALFKFGSDAAITTHTFKLIEWVTESTRALLSFARNLNELGLLYT